MDDDLEQRIQTALELLSVSVYRVEYWNGRTDGKGIFSKFPKRPILLYLGSIAVESLDTLKIGDHVTVNYLGSEVRCKILREPFPEIRSGVSAGHMMYAEPITEGGE